MAELKQYIFFDFEMLCSHAGMPYEAMEAIRLGAVKYDIETEQITSFDRYIQPISNEPLSAFCKELTGIDNIDLQQAESFSSVFEDFLTWVGGVKKSRFFSWSPSDLTRLKLDASTHGISSATVKKIEKRYVDFQAIFSKRVSKTNPSVEKGLNMYGLSFIGEKHNPMFDAYNTLRIYLTFLQQPLMTDLIMAKAFIFEKEDFSIEQINNQLFEKIKDDLSSLIGSGDTFSMKDATRLVKKTKALVKKYNNILINRSGLFNQDNVMLVEELVNFYHEFLKTYEGHVSYSAKILIFDDYLVKQIKQVHLKRG
ncbi:3'-5' exonuclease [Halalkalibacter urbisdiaboli]|uniref:3'-5' exonuclease n=1 Tax=Halalkalibacter urbisdiaboli TaxID=1960589 RepID=UPI000B44E481|nr:3'-5' exonuclease [Halalkalibacter urbisdiaboli]